MRRAPEAITQDHGAVCSSTSSSHRRTDCCTVFALMKGFVVVNFLPLGFFVGLVWAMNWPQPGRATASIHFHGIRVVEFLNNCMVFLVSGLTLKTSDFRQLARHWVAVVYGIVAILLITPVLALPAQLLPLEPKPFRVGLAIFCVVPTTLGVGVALTQVAHGNQAMALLLTVVTNMLGVVTVPYLLHWFLGPGSVASVSPGVLVVKLLMTVLVPTVVGMALRSSSHHLRAWVTAHRTVLSIFSSTNLVMIIWQTLSGARDLIIRQHPEDLVYVTIAAIVLHFVCLGFNALVAIFLLALPAPEAVASIIMSSQKSAPVAVTVISYITPDLAHQGLLAIPCIIGQLAQIFLGSAIARRLAIWVDTQEHGKVEGSVVVPSVTEVLEVEDEDVEAGGV